MYMFIFESTNKTLSILYISSFKLLSLVVLTTALAVASSGLLQVPIALNNLISNQTQSTGVNHIPMSMLDDTLLCHPSLIHTRSGGSIQPAKLLNPEIELTIRR